MTQSSWITSPTDCPSVAYLTETTSGMSWTHWTRSMSRSLSHMRSRCGTMQTLINRLRKWLRSLKPCGTSCMLPRSRRVSLLVRLTFFRAPGQDDSFAQEKLETSSTVTETCQARHLCLANRVSITLARIRTERRAKTRGARGDKAASSTCCVWLWWNAIVYVASRIQHCTTKHHRQRRRRAGTSLAPQLRKCSLHFVFRPRGNTER